jgi:WD40 repeat protein
MMAASISAICTLLLASCSSGGSAAPDVVDARSELNAGAGGATVRPIAVWGAGRAEAAAAIPGAGLVIASRTGLYQTDAGGALRDLDQFVGSVRVGDMQVSIDGTALVIGFLSPPEVRTYDLRSGERIARFELPLDAPVGEVAIGPSGGYVVDTPVGPFRSPAMDDAPTRAIDVAVSGASAVLLDGGIVAPVAGAVELRVSGPNGERLQPVAAAPGSTVFDVKRSPDGTKLGVTVGIGDNPFERNDQLLVLDSTSFTVLATVEAGRALTRSEWLLTDREAVIVEDIGLRVSAFDSSEVVVSPAAQASIAQIVASPNGLVVAHGDGTLAVFDPATWVPTVLGDGVPVERVFIDGDGTTVTSVDRFGGIATYEISTGSVVRVEREFATGEMTAVAVAPDGRLAVASSRGDVTLLDASLNAERELAVSAGPATVEAVAFTPSSDTIVAGVATRVSETAFDDTVRAWATADGTERFTIGGEANEVTGCSFFFARARFSPDGRFMAVASHDFALEVVEMATGTIVQHLAGDTTILDVAFSPDGAHLVATYDNGMVHVWNTSDYSLDASYRGVQGGYFAISVLPDGATMAAADITGTISLLRLTDGAVVTTLANASNRTGDIAVSPDGAILAAPTADGSIALWSTASGQQLAVAPGHAGTITGLAFSPNGDWIASSSIDGTARTWSVELT